MNTSSYLEQMRAAISNVEKFAFMIVERKKAIRREVERQHSENLRVHPQQARRAQGQSLEYRIKEALLQDIVFVSYVEDRDLNIQLATMYGTAALLEERL